MRIDLTVLGSDGIRVLEAFDATELAGGGGSDRDAVWEPVRAELDAWVRPDGGLVRASGRCRAEARSECDRCLKPVLEKVDSEFDLFYRWAESRSRRATRVDERQLGEGDLAVEELDGAELDTLEIAREQIELAAPIQTLCSDACAGLCASCGANRNLTPCTCASEDVDLRWTELRRLQNEG